MYVISQNLQSLIFIAQSQIHDQTLFKDLNTIFQFVSNVSLNLSDLTLESKIQRATDELTRVASENSQDKIAFLPEHTPADLKEIVLRIINNKDLANYPLQMMFMSMAMQPQY